MILRTPYTGSVFGLTHKGSSCMGPNLVIMYTWIRKNKTNTYALNRPGT